MTRIIFSLSSFSPEPSTRTKHSAWHTLTFSTYLLKEPVIGWLASWMDGWTDYTALPCPLQETLENYLQLEKWHRSSLPQNIFSIQKFDNTPSPPWCLPSRAWLRSWKLEVEKFLKRLTKWTTWSTPHWKSQLYGRKMRNAWLSQRQIDEHPDINGVIVAIPRLSPSKSEGSPKSNDILLHMALCCGYIPQF